MNTILSKPPKPLNEAQRLIALADLEIMDSEDEPSYQEIAELASLICQTPVALVTFIDQERQWFKAAVGTELRENTRDLSFCTHAIASEHNCMIVENATTDERFALNPLVTENPKIRFYAGVPLLDEDKLALGTICVLDVQPKELSVIQEEALIKLSNQVMMLIKQRKQNKKLKQLSEENERFLSKQINRQNKELQAQKERLDQLNKELEQMVYMASHDLQEPIRKLKMFADMSERLVGDNKALEKNISKIKASADRAHVLVKDILDFARLKPQDTAFLPVKLDDLIYEIVAENYAIIEETGTEITYRNLPEVIGDDTQLHQLFTNLISNAIKYNKHEPKISIDAQMVMDPAGLKGEFFEINVRDNGIGFDPSYSEKIFDFFRRLHSKTEYSGTGIGLAIVKKVVQNHKGAIRAESIEGTGSVFRVYLPMSFQ